MLEYGILLPFAMQLKKLYGKACRDVCVKYELTQTEFDILDFLGERSGLDTAGEIADGGSSRRPTSPPRWNG